MKTKLGTFSASFALVIVLSGCGVWHTVAPGTRVPLPVVSHAASPDDSTPKGINKFNNGFIGYEVCADGVIRAVITPEKRAQYAVMVDRYGDRYFKEQGIHLTQDKGVRVFDGRLPLDDGEEVADTTLFALDDSTLAAFALMRQWARNEQK